MNTKARIDNLRFLLRTLLAERKEYVGWQIPDTLEKQQSMMRALLNVRSPQPINSEFLQAQDTELRLQLADKGIVALSDIPTCHSDSRLRIWQGDITRLNMDAIVNAANNNLLGCFVPLHRCIDNAIHSAAGVQLRLECDRLMRVQGHPEPTGCAKITKGYNLPARYVLHTVGPMIVPQLCHTVHMGGPTWLPIYLFTLIGAYKYGWRVGLLTAIASPLLNSALFGMPALSSLPAILLKSVLLAGIAGYTAHRFQKVSVFLMLVVVLGYQLLGTLGEWLLKGDFYMASQDFRIGIPGMLIQIFGGYLFVKYLIHK